MKAISIVTKGILRKGRGLPLVSKGFLSRIYHIPPSILSLIPLYITKKIVEIFIAGIENDYS